MKNLLWLLLLATVTCGSLSSCNDTGPPVNSMRATMKIVPTGLLSPFCGRSQPYQDWVPQIRIQVADGNGERYGDEKWVTAWSINSTIEVDVPEDQKYSITVYMRLKCDDCCSWHGCPAKGHPLYRGARGFEEGNDLPQVFVEFYQCDCPCDPNT